MNKKAIKGCSMLVLVLLISIICFHTSSSAKVYRGTFEKNMKWSFDTQSKTVTVVCKGRMDDCDSGRSFGWHKWSDIVEKVVFSKGITSIGEAAFENFSNLREVILPEGVVSIGDFTFLSAYKLRRICFPSSLRRIGLGSFLGAGLTHISLKNVEKIGANAFWGTNIKSITIPSKCKDIKNRAFSGCHKLNKVIFDNGIRTIRKNLFCQAMLQSVNIPPSVTSIGSNAFDTFSSEESRLKSVTIQSTQIKKWGKNIFGKARKDLIIKVPKCRLKEYTKALRKGGLPKYVKIVAE